MAEAQHVSPGPELRRLSQELREWYLQSNSVSILITGTSATRKQSELLINGLIGQVIDDGQVGKDSKRQGVLTLHIEHQDVKITIWQSFGQNGFDKEDDYIVDILEQGCANADLVLYCVDTVGSVDHQLLKEAQGEMSRLTSGLGNEIWKRAVFVATSANDIDVHAEHDHDGVQNVIRSVPSVIPNPGDSHNFQECLSQWKAKLTAIVVNAGVDAKIAANIPIVPAGSDREHSLPDRDNWLSCLWCACILRMRVQSQPALLKVNFQRIIVPRPRSSIKHYVDKPLHEQPIIYAQAPVGYVSPPNIFQILEKLAHVQPVWPHAVPAGFLIGAAVGSILLDFSVAGSGMPLFYPKPLPDSMGSTSNEYALGGGGTDWFISFYSHGCKFD